MCYLKVGLGANRRLYPNNPILGYGRPDSHKGKAYFSQADVRS